MCSVYASGDKIVRTWSLLPNGKIRNVQSPHPVCIIICCHKISWDTKRMVDSLSNAKPIGFYLVVSAIMYWNVILCTVDDILVVCDLSIEFHVSNAKWYKHRVNHKQLKNKNKRKMCWAKSHKNENLLCRSRKSKGKHIIDWLRSFERSKMHIHVSCPRCTFISHISHLDTRIVLAVGVGH